MARFTRAVRDYLATCEDNATVISKKYHPTENGVLKMIPHSTPDEASQIRDTFRAERQSRQVRRIDDEDGD